MVFEIQEHVEFDGKGRAVCPSCRQAKGAAHNKKNLSINLESGAYNCFAGCTAIDIRHALNQPKDQVLPTALVKIAPSPAAVTVTPQQVREAHDRLMKSGGPARDWLLKRGINEEMISHYRLGVIRKRVGKGMIPAISIPIPAEDTGLHYYQKARIAPWLPADEQPDEYQPWSQYGIPAQVFFTWRPPDAEQTYLCEGEWDAILLGWQMMQAKTKIAVATFTCGCGTVPSKAQLDRLPGRVNIFYDRNDKPTPSGKIPGDEGAKKVAAALGDRAWVAQVPRPPDSAHIHGWDVSDAINAGYSVEDFYIPPVVAYQLKRESDRIVENTLNKRLATNDELVARAPDYTEWLVDDLLTSNELFLLAAAPRAGKSLLSMTLTQAVATGTKFLDRPVTQGPVIYVRCEDNEAKTKEREIAQEWAEGMPVYWLDRFKLSQLDQLREIAVDVGARLIVLDTLSRIRDDKISESSAEMGQLLEPLQEMAEELNLCILLVHHTGKIKVDNSDTLDVFDTIRGSSAIRATCRGTLILAADDRHHRLCVENGWGKHDLKVHLDPNTLHWKLLGKWNPVVNADQKSQALDYLNQFGSATLEKIAEHTGIPKKSLYIALSRLHADDMVKKQGGGKGKVVTYHRSSNNALLLEPLLEPQNVDDKSDRGQLQQKNYSSTTKGDQLLIENDHLYENGSHLGGGDQRSKPDTETVFKNHAGFVETSGATSVDTGKQQGPNPDSESTSELQQAFNSEATVEAFSVDHPLITPPPKSAYCERGDQRKVDLKAGDKVRIDAPGRFGGAHVFVKQILTDSQVEVEKPEWLITRTYRREHLYYLKRGSNSDVSQP